MTITSRLRSLIPFLRRGYGERGILTLGGGYSSAIGEHYVRAYGRVGWVYACVSRIATSVAENDYVLYKGVGKARRVVESHPLIDLLASPNPYFSGPELIELTQMWLDLTGEAFWVKTRNIYGYPIELWPVARHNVEIVKEDGRPIAAYRVRKGDSWETLPVEDVIHFRYPSPLEPLRGMGHIEPIVVDIDSEVYAAMWNRRFFLNNARADVVLELEQPLSDPDQKRLEKTWAAGHRGIENAHRAAVLPPGVKYKQVTVKQSEMSFIEQRKLNRDEILGVFGMPSVIMGVAEINTRAVAETAEYVYARYLLSPRIRRSTARITQRLARQDFEADLEYGYRDPTPENREENSIIADRGLKAGAWTVDEYRRATGQEPLPGNNGAVLYVPALALVTPVDQLRPTAPADNDGGAGGDDAKTAPRSQPRRRAFDQKQKDAFGDLFVVRAKSRERKLREVMRAHWAEQEQAVIAALEALEAEQSAPLRIAPEDATPNLAAAIEQRASVIIENDLLDWTYWADKLRQTAEPVVKLYYLLAGHQAFEDFELPGEFDPDSARAIQWLGERLREFGTGVTATDKESITNILREQVQAGASIPEMIHAIKAYYGGIDYQAENVARTEHTAAANAGALDAYHQAGIRRKEWLSTEDHRTRTGHLAANGQVVGIDEPFMVAPEVGDPTEPMMAPGQGSAANVCNCRCTMLPAFDDE